MPNSFQRIDKHHGERHRIQCKTKVEELENRQGLINGIGSIIKVITRNIDASDEDNINNPLKITEQEENLMTGGWNQQILVNKDFFNALKT